MQKQSSYLPSNSTVAVFGLGYVGCVTAACLSHMGIRVIGIDRDEGKVQSVRSGRAPFYEPGLEEIIRRNVAEGRLSASLSTREAVDQADIAMLCVGTPSSHNGNVSVEQLRRVSEEMAGVLGDRTTPLIVAVRSTVFPGTCEEVVAPLFAAHPEVSVVSNPEFLREGTAVRDFMAPSLLVVGGSDSRAAAKVASLYSSLEIEPCLVSLRTAEAIKYACNSFHALKVSFANEIGSLCAGLGVSGEDVMDTLCRDTRLNISSAYLKPGFAFGGSCLPKDLRALVYRGAQLDVEIPLLSSILRSNEAHLHRAMRQVISVPAERIGILGLAFKENTDDLRESPVIALIEYLLGKGRSLRIFDPHIRLSEIYGKNRDFVMSAIPHIGRLMHDDLRAVLDWAEYLVIAQKPDPQTAHMLASSGIPMLDLVGTKLQAAAQIGV